MSSRSSTRRASRRLVNKLKKTFSLSRSHSPALVTSAQIIPAQTEQATTVPSIPLQSNQKSSASGLTTFADALSQLFRQDVPQSFAKSGWNGFIQVLEVTERASTVFPPLQSAVGGFLAIVKVFNLASDNNKELEKMSQRISALSKLISSDGEKVSGGRIPQDIQDRVDAMTQTLEQHTEEIKKKMEQSKASNIANAPDVKAFILHSCRAISFIIELFKVETILSIERGVGDMSEQLNFMHDDVVLEKLKPVDDASYKSKQNRRGCMEGTRVDILAQLLAWATDDASQPIYWLNGMAGTGKSTIAQTFCERLNAHNNRLGASFFCSRASDTRKNVNGIIPTIAYQLARRLKGYRKRVITVVKKNSDTAYDSRSLQDQANELLLDLKELLRAGDGMLVIVIDALDECSSSSAVRDFLRVILRSKLPLKFLLISRPEMHVDEGFYSNYLAIDEELAKYTGFSKDLIKHQLFRLHDVERDIVAADITRYLRISLASTPLARGTPMKFDERITALVNKSDKLFIFAFTVVRYLSEKGITKDALQKRYSTIVQPSGIGSNLGTQPIDELYNQIFTAACVGKEGDEVRDVVEFVHSIVFLRKPLSVRAISELFCYDIDDIRTRLQHFYSVIDTPKSDDDPILTFHATFPDYISNEDRSKEYAANIGLQHTKLALRCLERMNVGSGLRKNICGIAIRQTPNCDISHATIQRNISSSLQYGCVFWASHLKAGSGDKFSSCMRELDLFVQRHILHWLECLSLMNELGISVGCLQQPLAILPKERRYEGTRQLISETQFMIPQSFHFLKRYALEIYHSALVWLPKYSTLKAHFPIDNCPRIAIGLDLNFPVCEQVLRQNSSIYAVAFSSDGSRIVSGSYDRTVRVWNVESGEEERVFNGHSGWLTSVSFSPDGSRIVSGSDDKTVLVWNVESGEEERGFYGHSDWVTSVSFSPDGSRIVSGSDDKTVLVWNVESGEEEKVFNGHSQRVTSVSFSPDGLHIVSGSHDMTARVWNVESGEEEKVFNGHLGWVTSVSFSPDGSHIISTVYSEDYLWNVESGKRVPQRDLIELTSSSSNFVESPFTILKSDNYYVVQYASSRLPCLWFWNSYHHGIKISAFSHSSVCLGYKNGRVVAIAGLS